MRFIQFLALVALTAAWLLCTNSGLNFSLNLASALSPTDFSFTKVEGKIIGQPIIIHELKIKKNHDLLEMQKLELDWQLGRLLAYGQWQKQSVYANIHAKYQRGWHLETADIIFGDYKLKAKSAAQGISAKFDGPDIKASVLGTLDKHQLLAQIKHQEFLIKVTGDGQYSNNIWQAKNLVIRNKEEQLKGTAQYNFKTNKATVVLNGALFKIATKLALTLKNDKLAGEVDLHTADISELMKLVPEMTRLKGKFEAKAKISGSLDSPVVETEAHLTDITATFPEYGVKIKPMELHVHGDRHGYFKVSGKGKMRRGPGDFKISGYVKPFAKGIPNDIKLIANNVEFINNQFAHLLASADVNFKYLSTEHRLDILGDLEISEGNIFFDSRNSSTTKSKDVVFVGEEQQQKALQINPTINLRIQEATHFKGFNLDADISGKLEIAQRNGTIYGTGRVTIKQGTYRLPGQTLQISKGRLLYPPGTILANPSLDIKMLGSKEEDLSIMVQGNAQKPVIRDSASGDQDKALSQVLTTGSGVLGDSLGKGKIRMPELGLATKDGYTSDFFADPSKNKSSLRNKDLVVGYPIGKKLHLQYLQGLNGEDSNDPNKSLNKRARLKYSINKVWALGLETGEQGAGADLSFAFEK